MSYKSVIDYWERLKASHANAAMDALILRRVFVNAVRVFYSNPDNYDGFPETLKAFFYIPDDEKDADGRTLDIDLDFNFDPKTPRNKPQVFVGCRDIQFDRKVLGDHSTDSDDLATQTQVLGCSTTVEIKHMDRSPDTCITLSGMTLAFFAGIRDVMKDSLGLDEITILSQTPPGLMNADNQIFNSSLMLGLRWQYVSDITEESLKIRYSSIMVTRPSDKA